MAQILIDIPPVAESRAVSCPTGELPSLPRPSSNPFAASFASTPSSHSPSRFPLAVHPTSATVLPLRTNGPQDTTNPSADPMVEFLRQLASAMSGGHNAEMLLQAAETIETLRRRAADAERLCEARSSELAHCMALREISEGEADDLMAELEALKEELEHTADEAERSRIRFADETLRLHALAEESHARLLALIAERETLQGSAGAAERTMLATHALAGGVQAPRRRP
jgi:hypothetical protein